MKPTDRLTPREREVLACAMAGMTRLESGSALGLQDATIRAHRRKIMNKLGAVNMLHACAIGGRDGLAWGLRVAA